MTPSILTSSQPKNLIPSYHHIRYNYGPTLTPVRVTPSWSHQSQNFSPQTATTVSPSALPILLALQGAGIHPAEGSWILYQLAKNNDTPYHAALLMNGKAYVVSQNDRIFYGEPGKLKPLKVVATWRTKCLDEQTRYLDTNAGLEIRIQAKNGLKHSLVKRRLISRFGIPLHSRTEACLPDFSEQLSQQFIQA